MDLDQITEQDKVVLKKKVIERLGLRAWGLIALREAFSVLSDEEDNDDEDENDDAEDEENNEENHDVDSDDNPEPIPGVDDLCDDGCPDSNQVTEFQHKMVKKYAKKGKQVDDLFASKLGGYPYMPKDIDARDYNDMSLVFQLNCADIKHELFPKEGLLQFFVGGYPNAASSAGASTGSLIKYWPTPDRTITLSHVKKFFRVDTSTCDLPFEPGTCQFVKFRLHINISLQDYRCPRVLMEEVQKFYNLASIEGEEEEDDDGAQYGCNFSSEECCEAVIGDHRDVGSNIGGHYGHLQGDPLDPTCLAHDVVVDKERAVTLLFLHSNASCFDPSIDLMWGDMGTGGWLIHKEDLANLDFDKHCFYNDC